MEINYDNVKVIGFDADDTLWINETYFREAEKDFSKLLSRYETVNKIDQELYKKEIKNLEIYGYGVKGFVLSMIEMAVEISNHNVSNKTIEAILNIGKDMINKPVILLEGVENVLNILSKEYRLILVTKGDLLDQERKLNKSGLIDYFHHIEVVSDKKEENYLKLLTHLDIIPSEFLMVGNSLKSDVLPLINIGAHSMHVPFHTTWIHEDVSDIEQTTNNYLTVKNLSDILKVLN
ncbi:MAG: HAD family hydrolase [Flavobacteriaceae bacterium]|jgi:putative hydrolase of the HAD superfamily|nr:HAD family hydrolase [Bacteroidota bacterium]MDG1380506.1 HAD family hydrolase [Flavobacteriaceae bacterium]MDG2349419.1 HAD family hydrolase [Flavobacteriaceae bacterium]|tara:strand:+ start:6290 stop:6994 length:705 start_codon:yes stop_codon:yes gene_type:complete